MITIARYENKQEKGFNDEFFAESNVYFEGLARSYFLESTQKIK